MDEVSQVIRLDASIARFNSEWSTVLMALAASREVLHTNDRSGIDAKIGEVDRAMSAVATDLQTLLEGYQVALNDKHIIIP